MSQKETYLLIESIQYLSFNWEYQEEKMKIFEYNAGLTFGTISGAFSENKYFDQQDFIPGVLANPFRSTYAIWYLIFHYNEMMLIKWTRKCTILRSLFHVSLENKFLKFFLIRIFSCSHSVEFTKFFISLDNYFMKSILQ